jgi:hypothetical protein
MVTDMVTEITAATDIVTEGTAAMEGIAAEATVVDTVVVVIDLTGRRTY